MGFRIEGLRLLSGNRAVFIGLHTSAMSGFRLQGLVFAYRNQS